MRNHERVPALDLQKFGVDPRRGFLPKEDPVRNIPALSVTRYAIAGMLPKILTARCMDMYIPHLEELSEDFLLDMHGTDGNQNILWAIKRDIDFIMHAYVHEHYPERKNSIPPNLARSAYRISKILGVPPILSYSTYALHNWFRFDPQKPIDLDNIALNRNFLGGIHEEWFILPHIAIEAKAAPAMSTVPTAQLATLQNNISEVIACLKVIFASQEAILRTLERIPERCKPEPYYNDVRPWIHGWSRSPMVYKGVDEYGGTPQRFAGETGAQSTIVPVLYAFLGIDFTDNESDKLVQHLDEMRKYMPPPHRKFIGAVQAGPSVRMYVQRHREDSPELVDCYNSCVESLREFLALHYGFAQKYIFRQQQTSPHNPTKIGTGGTDYGTWLKKHLDEVLDHRIL